jgi:hypothetical protein
MNDTVQTRLSVSDVFARSAKELDGCARLMRNIEMRILPLIVKAKSKTEDGAANNALQDIDLLVQTLEDIAVFMTLLSSSEGAEAQLQAQYSLSRMRLFDLRQRIAGAEVAASANVNRISLF